MQIKAGNILISAPSLDDPNFDKVVIFLTEYNAKGAIGFVINAVFPRMFNELLEFKHSKAFQLYAGGPVEKDSLYFLHRRADLISEGICVTGNIYSGGNFKQAVECINNGSISINAIKLFIGYCGWDDNQLETEIEEGSWLVCNTDSAIVFRADIALLWEELYEAHTSSDL
jgi:putative transcriptional regulator